MATTFETDDRHAGFTPGTTIGPFAWGRFNAALLAWQCLTGLGTFLASGPARNVPWTGLVMTTAADLVRYLVVVGVTAGFLTVFWRRFVATITATRPISSGEALAIVLMIGLLFGR